LCVQQKAPDDGQRNYAKHVDFDSKNKFEKLMHLVDFIVRIFSQKAAVYIVDVTGTKSEIYVVHRGQRILTTPVDT